MVSAIFRDWVGNEIALTAEPAALFARSFFICLNIINLLIQEILQRILVRVFDIQHRIVPVIPISQCNEEAHGSKCRFDQRHYNPEQNTELAAAINLGRFNQRIRKSHDVTLHDQKVVYAEQQRKEQCKVAVPQIRVCVIST